MAHIVRRHPVRAPSGMTPRRPREARGRAGARPGGCGGAMPGTIGSVQGSPSVRSETAPRWQVPRLAKDDRVLAGVAGGVAREVGVDPVVVRVGFVVLAAAGGIGVRALRRAVGGMRHYAERHAGEAYVPRPKGASEGGRSPACVLVVAARHRGAEPRLRARASPTRWLAGGAGRRRRGGRAAPQRARGRRAWAGDAARAVARTAPRPRADRGRPGAGRRRHRHACLRRAVEVARAVDAWRWRSGDGRRRRPRRRRRGAGASSAS